MAAEKFRLKQPLKTYQPRLTRFLETMVKVRNLQPYEFHLWRVMDGTAFQDAETALQVALYNAARKRPRKAANK